MTIAAAPGSRREPGDAGTHWTRFRAWRQTRPFWGAAISIFGGVWIYLASLAPLAVVVMQGLPGLLTVGTFLITVVLAGVTLFQPHLRSITGLLIVILGPLSIMATNLGGFVIGMISLVVGGALILSWAPAEEQLDLAYISGDRATGRTATPPVASTSDDVTAVHRTTGADATTDDIGTADPDHRDHLSGFSSATSTSSYEAVDPIPSSSLSDPARPAATRPAGTRPAKKTAAKKTAASKRTAPAKRTGLAGVFDTMFGTRKPMPPSGKRTPPATKRTPPPGKRPAGQRPAGGRPAPAKKKPPAAKKRPPAPRPTGGTSSGSTGSSTGSLSSIDRPSDPPTASVRLWVVIPLVLLALAAPGVLAGSAVATPKADGPFDWLFPPATPTPSASAPAATPSPGFSIPSLPDLLNPTPAPSASKPATDTKAALPSATCADAKDMKGTTAGGQAAIDAAAALQACLTAAAAPSPASDDPIGDILQPKDPTPASSLPTASSKPLTLKASRMEMQDFAYKGLGTINTSDGPTKVMHFTASSIKVDGMDQTYGFGKNTVEIQNTSGQATLKGHVNLYVTDFKSNIFGLIPFEFSSTGLQPPLVLPYMFFTDASSAAVYTTCDQILIPSIKVST